MGHVVGAEVRDHVDPGQTSEFRPVPQLNRQVTLWPVQDRLAVEAEDVNFRRLQSGI